MKVYLHPAAELDVEEAAAFYEKTGSAALAAKFIAEFKRVVQLLLEFPGIGSPCARGRRAFPMSLFPYSVVYRAVADGINVLVVRHQRRRPGYGGSRT